MGVEVVKENLEIGEKKSHLNIRHFGHEMELEWKRLNLFFHILEFFLPSMTFQIYGKMNVKGLKLINGTFQKVITAKEVNILMKSTKKTLVMTHITRGNVALHFQSNFH